MADIKLESDYWETSGIRDRTQNKTQRQINADFDAALDSEITARQNADSALQGSLNDIEGDITPSTVGLTMASGVGGYINAYAIGKILYVTLSNVQISNVGAWSQATLAAFTDNQNLFATAELPIVDEGGKIGVVRVSNANIQILNLSASAQNFKFYSSGIGIKQ